MARRVFTLLLLAAAGCSSPAGPEDCSSAPSPEDHALTLANCTSKTLVYLAVELQESHVMDPMPSFPVEKDQERLLAPGEWALLTDEEIEGGYSRGDDVRVFLYEVADGVAVLKNLLTLTHDELSRRDFRVEISEADLVPQS